MPQEITPGSIWRDTDPRVKDRSIRIDSMKDGVVTATLMVSGTSLPGMPLSHGISDFILRKKYELVSEPETPAT